jgi:quercetin dioxygenase-like cupin family protein
MNEDTEFDLGAGHPEEEREFAELAAEFGLALPLARPRPELKAKLMQTIAATPQNPHPGVFVIPASGGEWKQTPFPGAEYKPLYEDVETSMRTVILRLAAGAKYPRHRHTRPEQCLVLTGDVRVADGVHMGPGDFEWAEGGTEHDFVTTQHGCELLIIASRHDEILA